MFYSNFLYGATGYPKAPHDSDNYTSLKFSRTQQDPKSGVISSIFCCNLSWKIVQALLDDKQAWTSILCPTLPVFLKVLSSCVKNVTKMLKRAIERERVIKDVCYVGTCQRTWIICLFHLFTFHGMKIPHWIALQQACNHSGHHSDIHLWQGSQQRVSKGTLTQSKRTGYIYFLYFIVFSL